MIPFETPAIVGSSSCWDAVGSAGDFSGMRRTRHGCRPNRTPAAGRRDRRQSIGPPQPFPSPRRARQAKPSASPVCGLPLVQPPRRFRCRAHGSVGYRVLRGRNAAEACLPHRGSGGAGGVAKSFSGPTGLATRRFTSRGRCGSEGQRLYSPRGVLSGDARKSSERAAPRAAAADSEPVCHCPARKSGIRVFAHEVNGVADLRFLIGPTPFVTSAARRSGRRRRCAACPWRRRGGR